MINKLLKILASNDKKYLLLLTILTIVVSMVEVIGISAIMPFIALASDFTLIDSNEKYHIIYTYFNFETKFTFIIAFGVILILFYFIRSGVNLFYQSLLNSFTQKQYRIISTKLFKNFMSLEYRSFVTKNTSILTKSIINETSHLISLLSACLVILSETFIVVLIYAFMLYINYGITLLLTILLILNSILMLKTVSVKIKNSGIARMDAHKIFYEVMNRSFGNFKLLKLQSNTEATVNDFSTSCVVFTNSNANYLTLNQIPRLFLEALSFSVIILIIIYLMVETNGDISKHLATISLFVVSLYRLMPSANRIMSSYNSIQFYRKSLDVVYEDLVVTGESLGNEKLEFNHNLVIKNLSFSYSDSTAALKNININIKKGSKIGFIGKSGSGKSTLVDLIIGLHLPTKGEILLDNNVVNASNIKSLRRKIGYIPQDVYLFDGTVGENIVFGFEYDRIKIDNILKKVKMYEFLNTKNGQDTKVGEGGVMLSGGQKQRIAIGRALYIDPEILVLDEATSALDSQTEEQIIKEMYNISDNKTLIMIAHRHSTLDGCDVIYELDDGELVERKI